MSKQIQNFYKSTILLDWTIGTGNFYVTTKPTITDGWLVVSPNNTALREIVKYTNTGTDANGDYITISERGVGGTSEQTHSLGEPIRMNITAEYWKNMNDAIDAIVASGAPDAATDTKGLVEIATDAEVIAGTDIGGTGALLVPTPGQIKTNYEKIVPIVRTYLNAASPATWTKPAGLKYIEVEVQAGGGNSGNVNATSGETSVSGGGGSGGYSKKLITASSLGATETITIGAAQGNSSFGSHCSTTGGAASGGGQNVNSAGGSGGTATGGDINIPGGTGDDSYRNSGADLIISGKGADSMFGYGGKALFGENNGNNGVGYGSGAGGAGTDNSDSRSGGSGAPGIVIVKEFY